MKVFIRTRNLFDINIIFDKPYKTCKAVTVGTSLDLSWE